MRIVSGTLAVLLLLATLTLVTAPAQAAGGRQCLPRPAQKSLVVKGATTCAKVKKFLPAARELAFVTIEHGYERFQIKGFLCQIRQGDPTRFACHDLDGKPKRSFVWADRT